MNSTTTYRQRLSDRGCRQTSLWLHEDTLSALDAMGYRSRAAAIEALLANSSGDRNYPVRLALSGAEHETLATLAPMTLEALSEAMSGPCNPVLASLVEANLAQTLFVQNRGREAWGLFNRFGEWLKTSEEKQACIR